MSDNSVIFLDESYEKTVSYEGEVITKIVVVDGNSNNIDFGYSTVSKWVSCKKRRNQLTITIDPNSSEEERDCEIKVWNKRDRKNSYFIYRIKQGGISYYIDVKNDTISDMQSFPCGEDYTGCYIEERIVDVELHGGSRAFAIGSVKEYDYLGNETDYDYGITARRIKDNNGVYHLHIYNYGILYNVTNGNYYVITVYHVDKPSLRKEVRVSYFEEEPVERDIHIYSSDGKEIIHTYPDDDTKLAVTIPYCKNDIKFGVDFGEDSPLIWHSKVTDSDIDYTSINESMYTFVISVEENSGDERVIPVNVYSYDLSCEKGINITQAKFVKPSKKAPPVHKHDEGIYILDNEFNFTETEFINEINITNDATSYSVYIYTLIYDTDGNEITDSALRINNINTKWVTVSYEGVEVIDAKGNSYNVKKVTFDIKENGTGRDRSCAIYLTNNDNSSQKLRFDINQTKD